MSFSFPEAETGGASEPCGAASLVVGVGNPERGDDAAGRIVAQMLRGRDVPRVSVAETEGEGTALLGLWRGYHRVFLVDAVASGASPGTIHRHDVSQGPVPVVPCSATLRAASSHSFGVIEAVELARALGKLPRALVIYGIEGREFSAGSAPCDEVLRACAEVADRLVAELG